MRLILAAMHPAPKPLSIYDHGNARRTGVQHGKQRAQAVKAGSVANAGWVGAITGRRNQACHHLGRAPSIPAAYNQQRAFFKAGRCSKSR